MARTGRPRGFDTQHAIDRAMRIFWANGFEATSVVELKAAMGNLSAASFYSAFGSKEALFQEVLRRYLVMHNRVMAPLFDRALPGREAIETALRRYARLQTDPAHPRGCLMVLCAATASVQNKPVQAPLAAERARVAAAVLDCVSRAIAVGDLPEDTHAEGLATMVSTFLFGLSLQARDGATLSMLDAAIGSLMRDWDLRAARLERRVAVVRAPALTAF